MLTTLIAFVIALAVLIAVHEWGHYRMAVACGVKVLRFSIGFGPALLRFKPRRQRPGQDTEFVLAAIPLGGYVKMLDEREEPVAAEERHRAFNTQSLRVRSLVVAAGPAANLVLAVLLYAAMNWVGVQEPRAILASPVAGSLAEQAGFQGGELARRGALVGQELKPLASFESLRWLLTRGALDGHDVVLELVPAAAAAEGAERAGQQHVLPLSRLKGRDPDARMFRDIGLVSPLSRPVLTDIVAGEAAQRAGLQVGDVVRRMGERTVRDGPQLRELIRASGSRGLPAASHWEIEREGRVLQLQVQPDLADDQGQAIGRIGARIGSAPDMVLVRQGPLQGLGSGAVRVWEISALSLRLLGRMVTGQMSLKNLSGPIAIADYAGKSAALGLSYYLGFLAFISVSLGILNLLPVPVLDGGHLMYYLWEAATGRPVAGAWLARLQYVGMGLLLSMMLIAMYNDIVHRLG